jgi:hypothetical protein
MMADSACADADALRHEAEKDKAREQRWISLYTQLTGSSESEARACWMFAPDPPPPPAIIPNGDQSYDSSP